MQEPLRRIVHALAKRHAREDHEAAKAGNVSQHAFIITIICDKACSPAHVLREVREHIEGELYLTPSGQFRVAAVEMAAKQ